MKNEVIKELSTNEVRERIAEEKGILKKLKLSHAVSPVENPMKIKEHRKTIARLNTEFSTRKDK